jgi:hypothetical protein
MRGFISFLKQVHPFLENILPFFAKIMVVARKINFLQPLYVGNTLG